MIHLNRHHATILATAAALLTACGGGSGDTNATPTELSANQKAYESVTLAPSASYMLHWNFVPSGQSGSNFVLSDFASMAASPLTSGTQTVKQSAAVNISKTLITPTYLPNRVLKNGNIVFVTVTEVSNQVSYAGADVRVDTLASDNSTVAWSEIRTNFETVSLTGPISTTPADFAHFHNTLFSNPVVLNAAASWGAGASYVKYTQKSVGDRHIVFDCMGTMVTNSPSPCQSGTLAAAMASGMTSNSDSTTYQLTDGTIGTVEGVPMWIAKTPRPKAATMSATVQYRIYFEKNGYVYTGALIKDGTVLGGSYYESNPNGSANGDRYTFLPFDIRMNKAAHDSLKAALQL